MDYDIVLVTLLLLFCSGHIALPVIADNCHSYSARYCHVISFCLEAALAQCRQIPSFPCRAPHDRSHPWLGDTCTCHRIPSAATSPWRASQINWRFGFTIASSRESRKLSVDCRQESDNIAACTNLKAVMASAAKLARNSYTPRDVGCPITTNRCGWANSAQPPACKLKTADVHPGLPDPLKAKNQRDLC